MKYVVKCSSKNVPFHFIFIYERPLTESTKKGYLQEWSPLLNRLNVVQHNTLLYNYKKGWKMKWNFFVSEKHFLENCSREYVCVHVEERKSKCVCGCACVRVFARWGERECVCEGMCMCGCLREIESVCGVCLCACVVI